MAPSRALALTSIALLSCLITRDALSLSFTAAPRRPNGETLASACGVSVRVLRGSGAEIAAVSKLFTNAFYCAPTPLSEGRSSILGQSQAPLPPAVPESAVRSLTQRLASDMRSRYGDTRNDGLEASLLVAVDDDALAATSGGVCGGGNGALLGCAGLEQGVQTLLGADPSAAASGARLLSGQGAAAALACAEAADRAAAAAYGGGGGGSALVRPILANLAVAPTARRRGVASLLCEACEELAREWGHEELVLLVDERNGAARKLYSARGYRAESRDATATAQRVVPDARAGSFAVVTVPVVNLVLRKSLKGGLLGWLGL